MKRGLILIGIISVILLLNLIFAISPLISLINPTSAENGTSTQWNISITNNGSSNINFTQVNITFPSNFTIDSPTTTNGTSSISTTTLNGQTLSWTNNTYLVLNDSDEFFWVNATGTYPADYNITVETLDENSNTNSTNLSVEINSPSGPSMDYESPTPDDGDELNHTFIPVNVTATDSSGIDTITIYLYNSTGLESSQTSSSSPFFNNFTGLTDGETYKINATSNDTLGNDDSLSTRTITINQSSGTSSDTNQTNDTTAPIINVLSPENKTYTTNTIHFNATANENISEWKINYDGTNQTLSSINTTLTVQDGQYHLLLYAKDSAGNWGVNDEIYFTVNAGPDITDEEDENETEEGIEAEPVGEESKGAGSTILFIVIIVLVLAAIAGVVFALIHFKKKSKSQDSETGQGPKGPEQGFPPSSLGGSGQKGVYKPKPQQKQSPQRPKRHMPPRMQQRPGQPKRRNLPR